MDYLGIWDLPIAVDWVETESQSGLHLWEALGTAGTLSAAPAQSPTGPLRGSIIPCSTLDGRLCTVVHLTGYRYVPPSLALSLSLSLSISLTHTLPLPGGQPFLPCASSVVSIPNGRPWSHTHAHLQALFPLHQASAQPASPRGYKSKLPLHRPLPNPTDTIQNIINYLLEFQRLAVPPTASETQVAALHQPLGHCLLDVLSDPDKSAGLYHLLHTASSRTQSHRGTISSSRRLLPGQHSTLLPHTHTVR